MPGMTALIVDKDLGFVFWLGQALDKAGYEAIPARDVADATKLLHELKADVDVLIVNPNLIGAQELIHIIRRSNRTVRVLALMDFEDENTVKPQATDAIRTKPSHMDEIARLEWIDAICRLTGPQYRTSASHLG
jgi:DNA-binding response OmpR family regulator